MLWLWLLASLCLVGALAAQVVAVPVLAPVTGAPTAVEPQPTPPANSPTLAGDAARFPIVVSSFSDAASSAAAAEVAHANVMDADAELQAFDDTWGTLQVTDASLDTDLSAFLLTTPDMQDNSNASALFDQWQQDVVPTFTVDPDNAARLSNAAIALFMLAIAQNQGQPTTVDVTTPAQLALDSEWLLQMTAQAFPDQTVGSSNLERAAVIDLAGEVSTRLRPADGLPAGNGPTNPVDILQNWLVRFPNDVDARYLLGHLLASGQQAASNTSVVNADNALHAALSVLTPLASGNNAALGDSAIGDAYYSAARLVPETQPYHAKSLVWSALSAYDRALALNGDPGLFAARARALQYLGRYDDARASASRAATLSNDAPEAEVLLAAIDEARGDVTHMRTEARTAERSAGDTSKLTLDNVRFVTVDLPPYVALASLNDDLQADSYRSLVPHITAWWLIPPSGLGAAGSLMGIQVPQTRDPRFQQLRDLSLLPDQAAQLAIDASVVLRDASGADADYAAWKSAMGDQRLSGDQMDESGSGVQIDEQGARFATLERFDLAAHPASDGSQAAAFDIDFLRDTILRRARHFNQDATDWNEALPSLSGSDRRNGSEDLAEAQYLAGRYADARTTLMPLYGQATSGFRDGVFFQDLIATDVKLHRYQDAVGLIKAEASGQYPLITNDETAEDLGEITLDQGQARVAGSDFLQAAAEYRANQSQPPAPTDLNAADYVLDESNLGTALLQGLQVMPDTAPDCAAHAATCRDAASAYSAALTIDQDNAVVLMNLGWTQRLLGDTSGERASLEHAVQIDPTLFPALNDLGVMDAQSGDANHAAAMFKQAIAVNPGYDLATWNLGVLDMADVTSLPRAQSLLATAAQLNPNLRDAPIDYRTDERIYSVAFSRGSAPSFAASYSVGVIVLGGAGLLSLAVIVLLEFAKERGRELAVERFEGWRKPLLRLWTSAPGILRSTASSWATTVFVLLLATVIVALLADSPARLSLAAIAVFAAVLGMAVHETGHAVAARLLHRDVDAAAAPGGLAVVLLMIPLRLIGGPYLGHRVVTEAPADVAAGTKAHKAFLRRNLVVYLAGPLANAVVLVACAVVYVFRPVPALLVVLLVQLGIITFSLLPLKPLEGATLTEEHPRFVGVALFALVVVGVLFARDVL